MNDRLISKLKAIEIFDNHGKRFKKCLRKHYIEMSKIGKRLLNEMEKEIIKNEVS